MIRKLEFVWIPLKVVLISVQESAGGIKGLNLSKSGSQAKDLPEMARHLVHMVSKYMM